MKHFASFLVLLSLCSAAGGTRTALRRAKGETTSSKPRQLSKNKSKKSGGTDDPCDICPSSGRPDSLTLRYELPGANSAYQSESKASCRASPDKPYPEFSSLSVAGDAAFSIEQGTEFTISGDFDANTVMDIAGWGECTVHTSCSAPLIPGDKIGPFVVVGDEDCEALPDECIICGPDNKTKPPALTFKYISEGKDSFYQSEKKASCREDTYPETTTLTVETKTGGEQIFEVNSGDEFEVIGEFEANTKFTIRDWSGVSCTVHTSCSAPLVVGDQIGPFLVLEGNECKLQPPPCIVPDKVEYECGEDITVSFDYTDPDTENGKLGPYIDDWVGIYPCDNVAFKHAEAWLWACPTFGDNFLSCGGPAFAGTLTFQDPMPAYMDSGPHTFPIAPFYKKGPNSEINTCFQAVLLRSEGPSTPPYIATCLSAEFTINAGTTADCQVRPTSPAFNAD
jgi:hypothetical protein